MRKTYLKMKHIFKRLCLLLGLVLSCVLMSSCDMMHEDRDDCPIGLYLTFKYDYNLQHADMFKDHVGSVTLYVFDENGRFVKMQEESNRGGFSPLKNPYYTMHVDVSPGKYKFIALAGQKPYADMLQTERAKFVRSNMNCGDDMTALEIKLDKVKYGTHHHIDNKGLPLDTLWHGIETEEIEVVNTRPTYDTISLVRDTKKINITLRELSDPTTMDVYDYDMKIIDRNSHILWDNSLNKTDTVVYRPHALWNTDDSTPVLDKEGNVLGVGRTAHADFMTSRIIYHDRTNPNDGILPYGNSLLIITDKNTGKDVVRADLADMLSRLRTSDEMYRYAEQEFLDRGYDYGISFYLNEGKLEDVYISVSVNALSWTIRCQKEDLQ